MPGWSLAPISPSLNESPSEKEGKLVLEAGNLLEPAASMKVPPKRKGNPKRQLGTGDRIYGPR